MRKLNLRVLQRQQEVRAQLDPLLQLAVRWAAAQQVLVQRALAQQQARLALLELLRERYQPLVQPSRVLVLLVSSGRLLWRRRSSAK
jgi:hypothetical protein